MAQKWFILVVVLKVVYQNHLTKLTSAAKKFLLLSLLTVSLISKSQRLFLVVLVRKTLLGMFAIVPLTPLLVPISHCLLWLVQGPAALAEPHVLSLLCMQTPESEADLVSVSVCHLRTRCHVTDLQENKWQTGY